MKIALFVDGPSDRDTLRILARKVLAQRKPTAGLAAVDALAESVLDRLPPAR